jgi:hypothetical protein
MRVIRADSQCPQRVAVQFRRIVEGATDDVALPFIKPDQRIVDALLRIPGESLNVPARRLRLLPSRKNLAQSAEVFVANFGRSAAAKVVGEPVRVSGEDQVRREDRAARRIFTSAKGQARYRARLFGRRLLGHLWNYNEAWQAPPIVAVQLAETCDVSYDWRREVNDNYESQKRTLRYRRRLLYVTEETRCP